MKTFHIQPPSENNRRSALMFAIGLAALAAVFPLFGLAAASLGPLMGAVGIVYLAGAMRRTTCVLTPEALAIRGDLFRQRIPCSALLAAEARVVSLRDETQFQPKWRTFGTAWPDYLSGWFRLRSNKKAWILLTDWTRVVYLPTTQGYVLLLSVEQPDEFLRALREKWK